MSAKLKPTKNPTGEVLTLAEAAAFLRVEAEELRRAADAGRVPGRAIGAEWRFVKATLVEWLSQPETRSGPARTNRELADHIRANVTNETSEEQEEFLRQLRAIRKSWGKVGDRNEGGG